MNIIAFASNDSKMIFFPLNRFIAWVNFETLLSGEMNQNPLIFQASISSPFAKKPFWKRAFVKVGGLKSFTGKVTLIGFAFLTNKP